MLAWKDEREGDNSKFILSKLWFDIQSMCIGFNAMVRIKLEKFPVCYQTSNHQPGLSGKSLLPG